MKHVFAAALATIVAMASLAGVAAACPFEKPVTESSSDEKKTTS